MIQEQLQTPCAVNSQISLQRNNNKLVSALLKQTKKHQSAEKLFFFRPSFTGSACEGLEGCGLDEPRKMPKHKKK